MKTKIITLSLIIYMLVLSSCSTKLTVQNLNEIKEKIAIGYLYNLPKVHYKINIIRQLQECPTEVNQYKINIKTSVKLEPIFTHDPNHWYVINYDQLSSFSKTTDINITSHKNSMIKSINSKSKDKTIQVATGILQGIASTVLSFRMGGIGDPLTMRKEVTKPHLECKSEILTTLSDYNNITSKIKKENLILKRNKEEIIKLAKDKTKIKDKKKLKIIETKLKKYNEEMKKVESNIKSQDKQHKILLTGLTHIDSYIIEGSSINVLKSKVLLNKWFNNVQNNSFDKLKIFLNFGNELIYTKNLIKDNNTDKQILEGIIYRVPVRERLQICSKDRCQDGGKTLFDQYLEWPQYGKLGLLSFRNGIGQDNSLHISFTESGLPEGFNYQSNASGMEIGSSLNELSNSSISVKQNFMTNKKELVDLELNLLKAEQKLKECKEDPEKCIQDDSEK